MEKEYRFLLGATADRLLAFAEFSIRTQINRTPERGVTESHFFSASFFTVRPFNTEIVDARYVRDYLDGWDKDVLYSLCEQYDCTPDELPQEYLDDHGIEDIVDCSLYSRCVTIGNNDYMFESEACGQHDLIADEDMVEYTNAEAFMKLYKLWKKFHLKTLTQAELNRVEAEMNSIVEALDKLDEDTWVDNYLREHFEIKKRPEEDED